MSNGMNERDPRVPDLFPIELAQARFQEWMEPFVDDEGSGIE